MRWMLLMAVAGVTLCVSGSSLALAGDDTAKKPNAACKKGEYVNYADPATAEAFAKQGDCVSYVAAGGTLYPVAAKYCFDSTWKVIEDRFNGADGSVTSGVACAEFVSGGGSLAGARTVRTSETPSSFSYAVDAFNVTSAIEWRSFFDCWTVPFGQGWDCWGNTYGDYEEPSIADPYTYAHTGSVECDEELLGNTLFSTDSVSTDFTTRGDYRISVGDGCSIGTYPG